MAQLPKALIKKYGISKKAWSIYRASKSSRSSTRVTTMAKKTQKRYNFQSKRSKLMAVGGAILYGFGRKYLSNVVQSYLPSFAGQYTDEIVLGGLGLYFSNKPGLVGSVATAAYLIEGASIGNQLGASMFGTMQNQMNYN
jgi:hypothetical protein